MLANAEIPSIMTGTTTKRTMRRVVISPGVRIWYRFRIPPSCRTVEFPAKVGLRKEGSGESNSDGGWRAERWEREPVNMTRCFGNRVAITSSSLDKRDSADHVR